MANAIIDKIRDLFSGPVDPELIRLEGGKSQCSVCEKPITGKRIFKVPTIEKHYCQEHAQEEMERSRENSFNLVPDKTKENVKFSKDEGYYLDCIVCGKHMNVLALHWAICQYCNHPACKEHLPSHKCQQMLDSEREKREAETPRRCDFCGTRIVADTSIKCPTCIKFFCKTHAMANHHNCRGK